MAYHRDRLPDPLTYYTGEGLILLGRGKWRYTRCVFHGGSDSMRVNVQSGGFCCMATCGARGGDVIAYEMAVRGLGFVAAAKALGAWVDDPRDPAEPRRRPLPFPPRDALEVLAPDSMLIGMGALHVHRGGVMLFDLRRDWHELSDEEFGARLDAVFDMLSKADLDALLCAGCRVHAIALEVLAS